MKTPELIDALSEIYILREALKGAIVGDQIIERQFQGSDDKLHQWAAKQAAHNVLCNRLSLERSLEDFPWNGSLTKPAIAKAEGATP